MDEIKVIETLINEVNFEISLLDPTNKNDKLAISNLKAQRTKYQKYLEVLKVED